MSSSNSSSMIFLAEEQAGHALANAGAGLGQTLFEASKETGFGLFGTHRLDRSFHWSNRRDGRGDNRIDNRYRCRLWRLNNRSSRSRSNKYRHFRLWSNRRRRSHEYRHNDRLNHWRLNRLRSKRSRGRNRRRDVSCLLIFDQCHRLFRHRQRQPRLGGWRQRQWGHDYGFRFRRRLGRGLQHRLGDRQGNRRGHFFHDRRRCWLRKWLWLFDNGFLRLFCAAIRTGFFFFASRSWGLLVVVGTKHGGRLSHGSDAPKGASAINNSMQNRLRFIQLVHAQHFVEVPTAPQRLINTKDWNSIVGENAEFS